MDFGRGAGVSSSMPDEHIVFARMVAGFWGDSGDADEHGGAVAVVAYQCAVVFLSNSSGVAIGRIVVSKTRVCGH